MKIPDITVDCPACGMPVRVVVEAGSMASHIGSDGKAEASIQIRGVPMPHLCKGRESLEATA